MKDIVYDGEICASSFKSRSDVYNFMHRKLDMEVLSKFENFSRLKGNNEANVWKLNADRVSDSMLTILARRDFHCNSRDSITAILSTSLALSWAERMHGQVFPPESKSFASWGSESNVTVVFSFTTEVNKKRSNQSPSGGIICMQRRANTTQTWHSGKVHGKVRFGRL